MPGYQITSDGQVLGVSGRWLNAKPKKDGYKRVNDRLVHRLVALAWIGPEPEGKPIVRHLDGDPVNNHVSNLAWGTQQENMTDMVDHGRAGKGDQGKVRGAQQRAKSHCPQGHAYSPENTYEYPDPRNKSGGTYRKCRACHAARRKVRA